MADNIKLDLDKNTPGTDNATTVAAVNTWVKLFDAAKLKITGAASIDKVTLSDVKNSVTLGFDNSASSTINIQGVTFTLKHSGTTWTIKSDSPLGAGSALWTKALDRLSAEGSAVTTDTIAVQAFFKGTQYSVSAVEQFNVTCFYPGTLVRTPAGEVAVETLKHGDLVLTHDGREIPVAWLGRQTVSTVFADKLRVLPIRIKAGALGENVPARDLLVSPDHAMFIDGVLIHAGALVNDTSITRETNVPTTFTYFHVEVADHSLILAEGAAAETFVDNVDRLGFDNWNEYEALYPEGKTVEELPYPRAKARRQVPVSIRVALAARAEAIGAVAGAGAAVA